MRKNTDERCGFAAAYREGLGLAAVAVIGEADGVGIIAVQSGEHEPGSGAGSVQARWWCRSAEDAARIAASAARTLHRQSNGENGTPLLRRAEAAVSAAAKRLNVALHSDAEIAAAATNVVARVDAELQQQQASGGLKSVNKAYRSYRLDSSARGERVLRYDEWMRQYRENLMRQIAFALRQI